MLLGGSFLVVAAAGFFTFIAARLALHDLCHQPASRAAHSFGLFRRSCATLHQRSQAA